MRRLLPAFALALTVLVTGCGGDEDSGGSDAEGAPEAGVDGAADCTTDLVVRYPDGSEQTLDTSAEVVSLGDGAAFTFYVGDYEIPTDDITTATVKPPEGSHLAVVFLTVFNAEEQPDPIEAGVTVEPDAEQGVLTFSSILYDGAEAFGSASNATGELSVVAVSDESVCIDVDYADDEKTLTGQVAARVHDALF